MRAPILAFIVLGSAVATALPSFMRPQEAEQFEELSILLETNVADLDGEVVLHAESGQPIEKLALISPAGKVVYMIDASGGGGLGLSEIRLESGEPTADQVRAAYPTGYYTVRAVSTTGQIVMGSVHLSHEVPARWEIMTPFDGETIQPGPVAIEWSLDPSASRYTLEIEDESDERRLLVTPQPGQSRFEVPASLLLPGTEYQIVLVAHNDAGNRVVQERYFRTAPSLR